MKEYSFAKPATAIARIALAALILLAFASAAGATAGELRIAVVAGAKAASVSNLETAAARKLAAALGMKKNSAASSAKFELYRDGAGRDLLKVNGKETGAAKFSFAAGKRSFIKINGKPYRGSFEVIVRKGSIYVVNRVAMNDYLRGLVACEMEPESHIEALKAQAIVARSYALTNLGKHKSLGYDLCNSTCCQVYKGVNYETPKTDRAVAETSGMALVDPKGRPVRPYYCSSCGGYTEASSAAWLGAKSESHLRVVKCPYCAADDKVEWNYRVSMAEFVGKMKDAGFDLDEVTSAKMDDMTGSGRFYTLIIEQLTGITFCSVDEIKKIFGNQKIKSNFFEVFVENDGEKFSPPKKATIDAIIAARNSYNLRRFENSYVVFSGKGHGHGVGMCQNGAKIMAEKGKKYREIIKFYFTDSVRLKSV